MNTGFETRLNDLVLVSQDWKTNEIFKAESQKLINELCAMAMHTDPVALLQCIGRAKKVLNSQEAWLKDQLLAALDPIASITTPVQWVM